MKNGLRGVYHSVSRKCLQTYLDEYLFQYNRRDQGNLIFKCSFEARCGTGGFASGTVPRAGRGEP